MSFTEACCIDLETNTEMESQEKNSSPLGGHQGSEYKFTSPKSDSIKTIWCACFESYSDSDVVSSSCLSCIKKVEAKPYFTKRLDEANKLLSHERRKVLRCTDPSSCTTPPLSSSTAFVTFKSLKAAADAPQILLSNTSYDTIALPVRKTLMLWCYGGSFHFIKWCLGSGSPGRHF